MSDFYAVLKAELTNDPLARGYSSMTDADAAVSLNTANINRNRASMSALEISDNFDELEWNALAVADQDKILSILEQREIDPFGIWAKVFIAVFGASTTITNLQAARVEAISRAEELGLRKVKPGHVTDAKRLP